jgi:hypothetical protein
MIELRPMWQRHDMLMYQYILPKFDDGYFTDEEQYLLIHYAESGLSLLDFMQVVLDSLLSANAHQAPFDVLFCNVINELQMNGHPINYYLASNDDPLKQELDLISKVIMGIIDKLKRLLTYTASLILQVGHVDAVDVSFTPALNGYEVDVWYAH